MTKNVISSSKMKTGNLSQDSFYFALLTICIGKEPRWPFLASNV